MPELESNMGKQTSREEKRLAKRPAKIPAPSASLLFQDAANGKDPSRVHVSTCVHRPTKELPPSPFLRRPRRHRRRGRGAPLARGQWRRRTPVTPPPPRRKPAEESPPLFPTFPPFLLCAGDYVSNSRHTDQAMSIATVANTIPVFVLIAKTCSKFSF